jgi:serine/threonine-protein phosphatase Stp1
MRRMTTECSARTHVGRVRRLNEDNYLDRSAVGLWTVADGMGGHQAGDLASALIVEAMQDVDNFSSGYAFLDDVRDRLHRVNRTLLARAAIMAPGAVIGSTVVVLLIYEDHYACLWAGDSRIYLLRKGELHQLTRDHSMLQELIDAGSVPSAEARSFRRSNVITRAVGVTDLLTLDMRQGSVEAGDVFLLCSDGLTGMLEDREIYGILQNAPTLDGAADRLIERTLEQGARDNVTVVLVKVITDPEDTLNQTMIRSPPA